MTHSFYTQMRDMAGNYDAFIVDLWGVIHDGRDLYPGVRECLQALKENQKTVFFLSNAPRRVSHVQAGLTRFGITDEHYDDVLCSGEACFHHLTGDANPLSVPSDARYIYIGPEKDRHLLQESTFVETTDFKEAAFVVATGYEHDHSTRDEKKAELEEAYACGLPMVCPNPDLLVVRLTGEESLCAGVIAAQYEEMGGEVHYIGKPYPLVYEMCSSRLDVPKERIAAVGDSMITDIKGAHGMGLDSFLIPGGILARRLGITHGELPKEEVFSEVCQEEGFAPTGLLASFTW